MTNDLALSERIRPILATWRGASERRMFGGICFKLNGNMCVGTWRDSLIVRLDKKDHKKTLAEPHTKPFDINGRIMKGWALVGPAGIASDESLVMWVEKAAKYTELLPAK